MVDPDGRFYVLRVVSSFFYANQNLSTIETPLHAELLLLPDM